MVSEADRSTDKKEPKSSQEAGLKNDTPLARQLLQNPAEISNVWRELRGRINTLLPPGFGHLEINDTSKQKDKNSVNPESAQTKPHIDYKDGLEQRMHFKDGMEATFTRSNANNPSEITALEIKYPNKPPVNLKRVSGQENTFTDGKYNWKVNYKTQDDKLIVDDYGRGIVTTSSIDGITRELDKKSGLEISKRDGVINEIKDPKRNYLWQHKEDGTWQVGALDESKAFKAPVQPVVGKAEKQINGDYSFIGKDAVRTRFRADGTVDRPGSMSDLREKIATSKILDNNQKARLLKEYLPAFESRQLLGKNIEESNREKTEAIFQLSRLLEQPQANGYSDWDRGQMLEQTAFHLAHPQHFAQSLATCNVSDVGSCLLYESPSQFAKVMSEVGITGKFHSADGSDIQPPKEEIQAALRSQPFPVHPDQTVASGVSRAFGIIATNIFWQRKSKDPDGKEVVPKGNLTYRQTPGEGVYSFQNGNLYNTRDSNNGLINHPFLTATDIAEIGQQITGDNWHSKLITAAEDKDPSLTGRNQDKVKKQGPTVKSEKDESIIRVKTIDDLHKAFLASHSQIMTVHTANAPFYHDSGHGNQPGAGGTQGGWHVVVKTKYEPVYDANGKLDPDKSKVYLDNTWQSRLDHLTKDRAISLKQALQAMQPGPIKDPYDSTDFTYIQVYDAQKQIWQRVKK